MELTNLEIAYRDVLACICTNPNHAKFSTEALAGLMFNFAHLSLSAGISQERQMEIAKEMKRDFLASEN